MTHFPTIFEKRYAQYPRRYSNEYHFERHSPFPSVKGACATLQSARSHATDAIDFHNFACVRIFDRKIGQYVLTYTRGKGVINVYEGYVK